MKEINTAIFGGGCFWCTEAIFQRIDGVLEVKSGYSGGTVPKPSYEEVCSGKTGHAEVILIKFDPAKTSYKELLRIFMTTHDPTYLNRQGNDVGTQYRSVIFYMDERQKDISQKYIKELEESQIFLEPIITEIVKFEAFYEAEDYHQNYYQNNKNQPYCSMVIAPKLDKLEKILGS